MTYAALGDREMDRQAGGEGGSHRRVFAGTFKRLESIAAWLEALALYTAWGRRLAHAIHCAATRATDARPLEYVTDLAHPRVEPCLVAA